MEADKLTRWHVSGPGIWIFTILLLLNVAVPAPGNSDAVVDLMLDVPDAVVYWNNQRVGIGSQTLIQPAGDHELTIVLPDGTRQHIGVSLAPGEIRQLKVTTLISKYEVREKKVSEISLRRRTGNLLVVGPKPDLTVWLDGEVVGTSSIFVQDLTCGMHRLKVADMEMEIKIEPDRCVAVQNGTTVLLPEGVEPVVYDWVGPDSVTLFDDEKKYGQFPITVGPLPAQARRWKLTGAGLIVQRVETPAEGHVVRRIVAQVEPPALLDVLTTAITTVKVARAYSALAVVDAGSKVSIDDMDIGLSPIIVNRVLSGRRKIRVGDHAVEVEMSPDCVTQIRAGSGGFAVAVGNDLPALAVIEADIPGIEIKIGPEASWMPLKKYNLIENAGDKLVALRGEGIVPLEYRIAMSSDRVNRIRLVMEAPKRPHARDAAQTTLVAERAYGQLLIASAVPRMAVMLDGVPVGETTLQVENVLIGEHDLQVGQYDPCRVKVFPSKWTIIYFDHEGQGNVRVSDSTDEPTFTALPLRSGTERRKPENEK